MDRCTTLRLCALLVLCALLTLVGCSSAADEKYAELWPDELLELLEAPIGVLVWRIDPDAAEEDRREDLHGYGYVAGPVSVGDRLGDSWMQRLNAVLRDPGSFLFDTSKACIMLPGFMIQVEGPKSSADILLCFSCDELDRFWKGKSRIEDFDPVSAKLWELMREAYPDDPVFQKK